ncbi:hypothetical protein AMECASPLE_020606 [Ameca splendens]|uniref:Uncharacterized protein n=1 Tax=Ameca splendens TaxID=208324 RepID=A0ABV1A075_9TELE
MCKDLDKEVQSMTQCDGPPSCSQNVMDLLLTYWCQRTPHSFRGLVDPMPRQICCGNKEGPTHYYAGGHNVCARSVYFQGVPNISPIGSCRKIHRLNFEASLLVRQDSKNGINHHNS